MNISFPPIQASGCVHFAILCVDISWDVRRIYSVADQAPAGTLLIWHCPFRAPHHPVSHAVLAGHGRRFFSAWQNRSQVLAYAGKLGLRPEE